MSNSEIFSKNKGAIVTLVMAFGVVFLILSGSIISFILVEMKASVQEVAWNEAGHLAEAGAEYYKWCLNNSAEGDCLTDRDYYDAGGNLMGHFTLDVESSSSCGEITRREIISLGAADKFPETSREIKVIYGRSSVAKFAYLLNDSVWAGADREINGLYHSNGGVRMDGENLSLVSSNREEWICTDSFGCDTCPASGGCYLDLGDCVCPGVFTTTGNAREDLFDFPVPSFDFDGITVDLANIKAKAQDSGIYLPPVEDLDSSGEGYHLVMINDGTLEVRIITDLNSRWGYNAEEDWHLDYFEIEDEYLYNVYAISPSCSAVFVEDDLWIEGEVDGKVTVVSANLITPSLDTSVVLPGDLTYYPEGEEDGLALITEENILIPPDSPNYMELKGIFIAQKGRFGRNHYSGNIREKLEIIGTVVSNGRVGTQWISGSTMVSGYKKRENYIDPDLIYASPPFVPYVEIEFGIISWEELE